ncbi:MAG: AraC family transcriptional regulator [Rikenellaceae bacterium]|jgi:AraC-like DNA-binding protein|nr:AraC family transcriptional regulator [Rikenellaceae bacterium]MBQ5679499.1 AraC family transcriptional regulator [Rikenellaceae bacterium]
METELVELSVPEIKELLGNKDNRDDFYVFRASSGDHYIEGRTLRMKAFTLILCTDGMENGSVNLRDVSINKGSLLMSFPGNVLKIESGYPMATVRGIMLSQDFMRMMNVDVKNSMPLFMRLAYNPMIHLTQKQQEDIERYLDLLENISDNDNLAHRDQIVSGLVSSMFFRISDMYEQSTQVANDKELSVRNRREEYFAKFITLLSNNFKRERTVGFYAEQMCVTPKYLSLLIKEFSGKSAAEWIDNYVITEAKTLLRYSTMSIQEVAYELSFSSQSFFGKYFKHLTGMSPSEYKLSGK